MKERLYLFEKKHIAIICNFNELKFLIEQYRKEGSYSIQTIESDGKVAII